MPDHALHTRLQALREGKLDEAGQRRLIDDALAAGELSLACEAADRLAYALLQAGRPGQAEEVAERLLAQGPDFALLHTLALAEHAQGRTPQAIEHLQQALKLLGEPQAEELGAMRADMLEHLALFHRQQGQALRAWQVMGQALGLMQALGDTPGRMRGEMLMARLAREMGDMAQATDKWLTVVELARAMGRLDEEARALLELAAIAQEEGRDEAAASLRMEAIETLSRAGLWHELAHTLFQLGRHAARRDAIWQALWLMLALEGPLSGLVNAQAWLFMREDQKARPEAARVAAACLAIIERAPSTLPRHAELHRLAIGHLLSCARLQGIHETGIGPWMEAMGLRAEDGIIASTMEMIEGFEETGSWLFDRAAFSFAKPA